MFLNKEEEERKFKNCLIEYHKIKKDQDIVLILENSEFQFEWYTHDNWDGGFDIYNLSILIPLHLYIKYESDINNYSEKIKNTASIIIKDLRDYIQDVSIAIQRTENNYIHFSTKNSLEKLNHEYSNELWKKAIDRLNINDNEGAITIASTLLEDIMMVLLEYFGIEISSNDDIPKLYKKLAPILNLYPSQHTAEIFKQILGGCFSIIQGLGAFRNKTGDAHGRGKKNYKPAKRHAELVVNLSGTMTAYLISTFENINQNEKTII